MSAADEEVLQALLDRFDRRAILPIVLSEREATAIHMALAHLRPHALNHIPGHYPDSPEPLGCDDPICEAFGRGMEVGKKQHEADCPACGAPLYCSVCGERREPEEADYVCRKGGRSVPEGF